ncbi:MAG: right-handed parallel beta-helix repeat-containing protein, partial [Methanosarcinales archaeon]
MGTIEEKFAWDGQIPRPSNMKFTYEDANALSEGGGGGGGGGGATLSVAASNALNPGNYDYQCTGSADQVIIQQAIAALPTNGGKVMLSEGDFNITAAINLASATKRIHLCGFGQATCISNGNTSAQHAISAMNTSVNPGIRYGTTISDLRVKGNASSGSGICLAYCDCPTVVNVTSISNGTYGILLLQNGHSGSEADPTIAHSRFMTNHASGLRMDDVHDLLISATHFEGNSTHGVEVTGHTLDVKLTGCNIEDNAGHQVYFDTTGGSVQIVGCVMQADATVSAIFVQKIGYGRITIAGNTIEGGTRGICMRTGSLTIKNLAINGNAFWNQTVSAITLGQTGDTFKTVSITGNISGPTTGYPEARGIYLTGCNGGVISSNTLTTKGVGVALNTSNNVAITGNTISAENIGTGSNDKDGLRSVSCEDLLISSNRITKEGATDLEAGISIVTSTGEHRLVHNFISGATTDIAGYA